MRSNTCCPARAWSRPEAGELAVNSLMSAPATNDLSPAPVMTIVRTPSSRLSSSTARRRSSRVETSSALRTLGRLIVMMATAASRSISRLSKAISNSNYIPGVQRDCRDGDAHRVGNDIHGLDAAHRHERLVKFIADAVRRANCDRRRDNSERHATTESAAQGADHEHAEPRIQHRVQILVDAVHER